MLISGAIGTVRHGNYSRLCGRSRARSGNGIPVPQAKWRTHFCEIHAESGHARGPSHRQLGKFREERIHFVRHCSNLAGLCRRGKYAVHQRRRQKRVAERCGFPSTASMRLLGLRSGSRHTFLSGSRRPRVERVLRSAQTFRASQSVHSRFPSPRRVVGRIAFNLVHTQSRDAAYREISAKRIQKLDSIYGYTPIKDVEPNARAVSTHDSGNSLNSFRSRLNRVQSTNDVISWCVVQHRTLIGMAVRASKKA